jgi:hypothetical protein
MIYIFIISKTKVIYTFDNWQPQSKYLLSEKRELSDLWTVLPFLIPKLGSWNVICFLIKSKPGEETEELISEWISLFQAIIILYSPSTFHSFPFLQIKALWFDYERFSFLIINIA